MKFYLLFALIGVSLSYPTEDGVNEEEKQNLVIEELRQNLTSIWSELNGLKVNLETHIKETDPQNYYDPRDDHGYGYEADHHHDHHGHHDVGHHEGGHEGGHHDEHHHHDPHSQGPDQHHEGDQHHEATDGKTQESGYDQSYGDHHHHYEDYDHHHHHHEDYDHHQQQEGTSGTQDHHKHHQRHHEDDEDDDHHQDGKDDDSHEDNSEEKQNDGKAPLKSVNLLGSSKLGGSKPGHKAEEEQYHGYYRMRQEFLKARCNLHPNSEIPESNVTGHITISQKKDATGPLYFKFHLKGFDVSHENGLGFVHGFHIHENEVQEHKCSSAGAHFNPYGNTHGAPYDVIRHVGDLGNIRVDNQGRFDNRIITDDQVTFIGKNSIIGRSIVVHEKADDLGLGGDEESLKTGNAGARLACCTIESINVPQVIKPSIRFNG